MRTDEELVRLCRKGNEAAFIELLERYKRLIYSIPIKKFRFSQFESDEIFSRVLYKFINKLDTIDKPSSVKSWLCRTAWTSCMEYLREKDDSIDDMDDLGSCDPDQDKDLTRLELKNAIEYSMAKLRRKCRELLDKRFYQKESYENIADEMGYSKGTIGGNLRRCLEKLRKILDEHGYHLDDFV